MSTFSSLFQSGTAFYGDPFGPIIDTISDFGWSLLPQFPGSIRPSSGGGGIFGSPVIETVTHPQIPVAYEPEPWLIEAETTYVPPVLVRPVGTGASPVPREVVVVEGVSTEVEQHDTGDFPAGSIFAPGQVWGNQPHDFDAPLEQEEEPVAHDWGHLLRQGIGEFVGIGGPSFEQPQFNALGPAFAASPTAIPGGAAALPPSAAGYVRNGTVSGQDCGNRRYVTLDRETGKISCKRRRRRRLLTNRDLADLASLKTITGGGAALNAAVIRAVR